MAMRALICLPFPSANGLTGSFCKVRFVGRMVGLSMTPRVPPTETHRMSEGTIEAKGTRNDFSSDDHNERGKGGRPRY
jgi:hypothetical protein